MFKNQFKKFNDSTSHNDLLEYYNDGTNKVLKIIIDEVLPENKYKDALSKAEEMLVPENFNASEVIKIMDALFSELLEECESKIDNV